MLDLNLDMVVSRESSSSHSFCEDDDKKTTMMMIMMTMMKTDDQPSSSKTQMEDSGTSNSSIINCEEPPANAGDENSSNTTSAFIFDIMKKDTDKQENNNKNKTPSAVITHQLFPVAGDGAEEAVVRPDQWLNLSNGEPEQELKAVQQKQQQVRKSRRGPRSKSSQYRGVTFYRRTSRWESHIW